MERAEVLPPPAMEPPRSPLSVDRHLDLLGFLFVLAGILAGLAALALLALGFGALATAYTAEQTDVAAGFASILFIGFAVTVAAFGACLASTGMGLRHRRHWSRPIALILSLVSLLIVPFGTAVGVYGFWVLLRQRSRELLGAA